MLSRSHPTRAPALMTLCFFMSSHSAGVTETIVPCVACSARTATALMRTSETTIHTAACCRADGKLSRVMQFFLQVDRLRAVVRHMPDDDDVVPGLCSVATRLDGARRPWRQDAPH